MDPQQWELLDSKVAEAQKALEAARAARTAEAARVAEAATQAGRTGEFIEAAPRFVIRGAASEVATVLGVLLLFWPSTAEAPTLRPETEYEIRLSELAHEAREIREALENQSTQVDAAKKDKGRQTPKDKPAPKEAPKEEPVPSKKRPKDLSHLNLPSVDPLGIIPDVSGFPPGERPCLHIGTEGAAMGREGPGNLICVFDCGGKTVRKPTWGYGRDAFELCREKDPKW